VRAKTIEHLLTKSSLHCGPLKPHVPQTILRHGPWLGNPSLHLVQSKIDVRCAIRDITYLLSSRENVPQWEDVGHFLRARLSEIKTPNKEILAAYVGLERALAQRHECNAEWIFMATICQSIRGDLR
jgi:hypothetical protein